MYKCINRGEDNDLHEDRCLRKTCLTPIPNGHDIRRSFGLTLCRIAADKILKSDPLEAVKIFQGM